MTATLNGFTCTEVRATMPRYGYWTGTALLGEDTAIDPTPGGATLTVAGLDLRATAVHQGTRGGYRGIDLVGGYGGWGKLARPDSKGLGNGVKLSDWAAVLGAVVGERVLRSDVAAARVLGRVVARHGQLTAGELLTQACALPPGAAPIPWWVAPDGDTHLGPRDGTEVDLPEVDSDDLDVWRSYEVDDATPLLPGNTIDGRVITELGIAVTASSSRLTVALDAPAPSLFRRAVLRVVGPMVAARTLYRYVFRERLLADGSYRATAVRARFAPDLPSVFLHPGLAGGRALPQVGSQILVAFADGNPADPVVVAFEPGTGAGVPLESSIYASAIHLAGTIPIALLGGLTFRFIFDAATSTPYVSPGPAPTPYVPVAGNPQTPAPPLPTDPGTEIRIVEGSSVVGAAS